MSFWDFLSWKIKIKIKIYNIYKNCILGLIVAKMALLNSAHYLVINFALSVSDLHYTFLFYSGKFLEDTFWSIVIKRAFDAEFPNLQSYSANKVILK